MVKGLSPGSCFVKTCKAEVPTERTHTSVLFVLQRETVVNFRLVHNKGKVGFHGIGPW